MLGSAAVSACCCVVPRAGASRRARILAGATVAVVAAVTLDAAPVVQHAGTLLLLALAVAIVVGGPTERGPELEWHRMAGGRAHGARAATAAYLCWMTTVLVRLRNRPITDLLRWEHLAMGASLAAMIFFMS